MKVERAPAQWEPPTPVSAANHTSSASPTLGKWAPPLSKWARPPLAPPRVVPPAPKSAPVKPALSGNPAIKSDTSERPSSGRPFITRGPRKQPAGSSTASPGLPSSSIKWGQPEDSLSSSLGKWTRANPPAPTITTSTNSTASQSSSSSWSRDEAPHTGRVPSEELQAREAPRAEVETRKFSRTAPQKGSPEEEATNRRRGDPKFKQRGSLLGRLDEDVSIPHRPRVHEVRTPFKPKVQRSTRPVKVNPDVLIPSVVSVGNLARLLNVRLGGFLRIDYVLYYLNYLHSQNACAV